MENCKIGNEPWCSVHRSDAALCAHAAAELERQLEVERAEYAWAMDGVKDLESRFAVANDANKNLVEHVARLEEEKAQAEEFKQRYYNEAVKGWQKFRQAEARAAALREAHDEIVEEFLATLRLVVGEKETA